MAHGPNGAGYLIRRWTVDPDLLAVTWILTIGPRMKDRTRVVSAGRLENPKSGSVNPPVHHTSTVLFPTVEAYLKARSKSFEVSIYGRLGTPTSAALETALCEIEGGFRTLVTSSGMAAVTVALGAFLSSGDHLLMVDTVYDPVRSLCDRVLTRMGIGVSYYDPSVGAGIAELITPETRLVYVESPGSLTFEVQDVPAIAHAAHQRGALVAMDNTWSTPLNFNVFNHGIDISLQSLSKYVGGHSDLVMGAVTTTEPLHRDVRRMGALLGTCPGPDDCYLAQRGMRTLAARLRQHQESGLAIASWLAGRPEVSRVLYPALSSDPGHTIWRRDFSGAGGLFGVVLNPVSDRAVHAMLDGYEHFGIGVSWGGFESLVIPTSPERHRTATAWTADGPTVRYYIGLEDVDDLIADLERGFNRLRAA